MVVKLHVSDMVVYLGVKKAGGSIVIVCEKCGAKAQFRKKHLKSILLFMKDHIHSR